MRAMLIRDYAAPLAPAELPAPELTAGHALLEVLTCGVCFSDVKTARGRMPYSAELTLPHVPGHEICARVIATDPPGAFADGELVVVYHLWPCRSCAPCRSGREMLCRAPRTWLGFTHPGGFRERLVAPLDRLTRVPAGIDPVHAAPLTCALGTAYRAVVTRGGVRPGTRVAVIGLGGVGIHALQIAAACGAWATGLDISARALEVAAGLGLDARHAQEAELEPCDVVIDAVGNPRSIEQAQALVAAGGRIVVVGYGVGVTLPIASARTALEEVELVGSRYVALDELARAIRLVADGRVQIVVDRVLPLAQAEAALAALEAGEVVGRVVLDVAGVA